MRMVKGKFWISKKIWIDEKNWNFIHSTND
jgi:hypothetical protein